MRKLKYLFPIVLIILVVMLSLTSNLNITVNAYSNEEILIATKYTINEKLDIPKIKLSYNNKEYEATSYVKYPSGKIINKKIIDLNESGLYEVTYLAKAGSITLSKVVNFSVTNELYSLVGDKSEAYYGTHEYMPNEKGIIVSIAPNETFEYNKPIDLTAYNKSNKIVTLNVLPRTIGIADCQKIFIRLTDIYDPNNFITVEMKKVEDDGLAWAENSTYVVAYSNGQDACGLESGSHPTTGRVVEYRGQTYTIHQNNYYGAYTVYSMPGAPRYVSPQQNYYDPKYVGEQEFSVAMDYAEGIIYGGPFLSLVNDLRSDVIYGSNFWTGFTTGEAYLSISGINYNSDSLNLIIKEIAGNKTSSMEENVYEDLKAPSLDIKWDGEFPKGIKGINYPLFDAYAYDEYDHEEKEVKKTVYLNYGLKNEIIVPIENNSFVTDYIATYYIKYETKDKAGNISYKIVPIEIKEEAQSIEIDNMSDANLSFNVFDLVDVKRIEYKNAIGFEKEVIIAYLKDNNDICYNVENHEFRPLYAGKYVISYQYSDFLTTNNYQYEIDVLSSSTPLIEADIKVPSFLIKDCEYTLPSYSGYIFNNNELVTKDLDIYVIQGGTETRLDKGVYKPNTEGNATISYRLNNNGEIAKVDKDVLIIDTGYASSLTMGKYFYSDNVEITHESKYVEYSLKENKKTNLEFINGLPSSNFNIRLAASDTKANFSKINLYLTDMSDEDIKIKFTYEKEPTGYVKFYINDLAATNYNTLFASSDSPIICEYNNRTLQVSPHPSNYQLITKTVKGEEFTGFKSDKIKLEIEIDDVSGDSALRIINLCGQPFTKVKADIIEPKVYVYNDVGEFDINSTYTLQKATIADVLDPNIEAFIRVKDPDGIVVSSTDGVLLDKGAPYNLAHKINLDKYGIYQVYYEAVDSNNNTTQYSFIINVIDKEEPIVKIINPITRATLNEYVDIAKIEVFDNYSKNFEIYVSITTPNGNMYPMTRIEENRIINKAFKAIEKGTYTINYFVADEAGNSTFVYYKVTIE